MSGANEAKAVKAPVEPFGDDEDVTTDDRNTLSTSHQGVSSNVHPEQTNAIGDAVGPLSPGRSSSTGSEGDTQGSLPLPPALRRYSLVTGDHLPTLQTRNLPPKKDVRDRNRAKEQSTQAQSCNLRSYLGTLSDPLNISQVFHLINPTRTIDSHPLRSSSDVVRSIASGLMSGPNTIGSVLNYHVFQSSISAWGNVAVSARDCTVSVLTFVGGKIGTIVRATFFRDPMQTYGVGPGVIGYTFEEVLHPTACEFGNRGDMDQTGRLR